MASLDAAPYPKDRIRRTMPLGGGIARYKGLMRERQMHRYQAPVSPRASSVKMRWAHRTS
jgi:hypothetical protein